MTAGFTAFSALVRYPEEVPELVARAYGGFRGSRPRPVNSRSAPILINYFLSQYTGA